MSASERPPRRPKDAGKTDAPGSSKESAPPTAPPEEPDRPVTAQPATRQRPRRPKAGSPSRSQQDAWVERLREGDESALVEVIHAYGERITAVVSGILRDRDAVDDVVQSAFTKAWFRIASFKGDAGLYTWLYRVAVNASKDYIKSRSRRPMSALDDQVSARIPSTQPHVIEGLERRELRLRVRKAVARLPERYRTVLALRELEGLTYQQIAEVLGLSLGTVESRLFRARRRLKAILRAERGSPPELRPGADAGEKP